MDYTTKTLAAGCFGKVYKQQYNGTWAAIKKVPQHLINEKDLKRECKVYDKAIHPNIVKLLGKPILKQSKWIIPMEFIFGEELETSIFESIKSKIQLTPSVKATIIAGMCEGLYHLHSKRIVHQDLKPENIMIEHKTFRAVIIDMGLAKFNRYGLNSAKDMGNEAYSPPEVLQSSSPRDERSDVWAMGKIIAELCARVRLYTPSVCPAKIQETLKIHGQQYCNIVCRMVDADPKKRATMANVIPDIRRATGGGDSTHQQRENHTHNDVKDKLQAPEREPQSRWQRDAASPNPKMTPPKAPVPSGFEDKPSPRNDIKMLVRAPVRVPPSRWELAALPKTEVQREPIQLQPTRSRWEMAASPKHEVENEEGESEPLDNTSGVPAKKSSCCQRLNSWLCGQRTPAVTDQDSA
ncbi:hypothetical protein UPYG_G00147060 [Umbra pygmaea]|uniref:Protein kinase domain-containing protein n=1 Tax=Umbra pygmaea TaxID=75934 RepID=A0ABD0X105_UMBPY